MKFKRAILAIAAACTLALAGPAVSAPTGAGQPNNFEIEYDRMLDQIRLQYTGATVAPAFWDQIKTRYRSDIDSPKALRDALDATITALGDSRAKLLSAAEVQALEARARSAYIGVGVSLKKTELIASSMVVENVEADSPAEEAGLKPGDKITHIDGESVDRQSFDQAVRKIRGEPGSTVNLTVDRNASCSYVVVNRDLDRTIGVSVKVQAVHNAYTVDYVREHAPADTAGIQKDDTIVAIDGSSTDTMNLDQVVERIGKGAPGSQVSVKFERHGKYLDATMTRAYLVDMSKSVDMRGNRSGSAPGYWQVKFKHLDWRTIDKDIGHLGAMFENENIAVILDLRAPGNDPDVAAKVASWFIDSGVVLRYEEGSGADKVTTTYAIKSGAIVKSLSGAKSGSESIALPEKSVVFTKRVIVLVDDNTTGTSEALAHALHSSGRATVTGSKSAGDAVLTTQLTSSDGTIVAQLPTRTLVNADGSTMGSVTPDTIVSGYGDVADYARYQIDGEDWHLKPSVLPVVGGILVLFFFVVLATTLTNRNKGAAAKVDVATEAEASSKADVALPPDATTHGDGKRKRTWNGQQVAMLLALLAIPVIALCVKTMFDFRYRAPTGYHSEIIVTAYVGDDNIGRLQRKAVEELASEYSGDIKFNVVDIAAHPELATDPDWGPVSSVPAISVKRRGYGADGTTVKERSGLTSMPMTKRQIVGDIESMAAESRPFWPGPEIKRERKTKP